jgi:hypothetical protein
MHTHPPHIRPDLRSLLSRHRNTYIVRAIAADLPVVRNRSVADKARFVSRRATVALGLGAVGSDLRRQHQFDEVENHEVNATHRLPLHAIAGHIRTVPLLHLHRGHALDEVESEPVGSAGGRGTDTEDQVVDVIISFQYLQAHVTDVIVVSLGRDPHRIVLRPTEELISEAVIVDLVLADGDIARVRVVGLDRLTGETVEHSAEVREAQHFTFSLLGLVCLLGNNRRDNRTNCSPTEVVTESLLRCFGSWMFHFNETYTLYHKNVKKSIIFLLLWPMVAYPYI